MSPTKADGQTEDYSGTQLGEVSHTTNIQLNKLALDAASSASSASLLVYDGLILTALTVDATKKVPTRNVFNYKKVSESFWQPAAGIGNSVVRLDY